MRRRTGLILILIFLFTTISLPAVEGLFQINTVYQGRSYPLFGSGGKDIIRHSSAGIALKSTRGTGLHGVLDIAVLFPYKLQEKIYPAANFSDRAVGGFSICMDALLGIGYRFNLDPIIFFISGGFHSGALFDDADYLAAFGLGFDVQTHLILTEVLTAQIGLKYTVDFWGFQNFVSGSSEFAGFPTSFGFYTGLGLSY